MKHRRAGAMTGRTRSLRVGLAAVCVLLLPIGQAMVTPQAAYAASQQAVGITTTVGSDRVVSVKLNCLAAASCKGKLTLTLQTGGTKTLSYSVAKKSSKTLTWKLTSGTYKKFIAKKQSKLTVKGKATKPSASSFSKSVTLKASAPQLKVSTKKYTVAQDRKVAVGLTCGATAGCTAKVELQVAGATVTKKSAKYAQGKRTAQLTLTKAQWAALGTVKANPRVVVTETKPYAVAATPTSVTLTKAQVVTPKPPEPEPEEPQEPEEPEAPSRGISKAYAERNWNPTEHDTCSAALHASYRVVGPDGKYYPTWHPAQVTDPATGQTCNFGHEHGADPHSSSIYSWVADYYAPDDLVSSEVSGLPFGYVSEELDNYIHEHGDMAMRHEDNGGHKVFVANDVKMLDSNKSWVRAADGSQVVCNFLIKQHQGSWSADATSNNAHELLYAQKCSDGTEIITSMLSRFGNSNEMFSTCATSTPMATVGSKLPAGEGGKRIIPTYSCVKNNPTDWSLYELWEGDNRIHTADNETLVWFEPWFGVRNPSRVYDANTSTDTVNGISRPLDLAWLSEGAVTDYLWYGLGAMERFEYRDPRSPFDGAQRDFYLRGLQVSNTLTGSGIVYSDPYGGNAKTTRTVGSIPQLITRGSALGDISLAQQKFDKAADYGKDNGVHAPN